MSGMAKRSHVAIHAKDDEAFNMGITLLDEFNFPHAVYKIQPQDMTNEGLKFAYTRVCGFLGIKEQPDTGLTVMVAP